MAEYSEMTPAERDAHCAEAARKYRERESQQRSTPPEKPNGFDPEVARLAELDPIAYDRERLISADELGCRVSTLDSLVAKARAEADEQKQVDLCADTEPCAQPVDVGELLDDVRATIRRFIICDDSAATAAALWIAFTWIIERAQVAPLAIVTAPEKGCGKSQLLDVIGRLSKRPLFASNISPAATFRIIEARTPTLLIDEADAFFKENEELRGIINSGHTRASAYVIRTVGDDFEVKQFSTWGAKAIAGIGRLPETVMSRGIVLSLRRKLKTERVERLRHAEHGLFDALARRLARFGQDYGAAIAGARPQLPEALGDREQDNWEHLLAIADLAAGPWPKEARRAARTICGAEADTATSSEELLADIRDIFDAERVTRISMAELLRILVEDETAPWATWNRGRPMSARQLGSRLKEFGIQAGAVSIGQFDKPWGFKREQFEDAWARYLNDVGDNAAPDAPSSSLTPSPRNGCGNNEVREEVSNQVSEPSVEAGERSANLPSPLHSPIKPKFSRRGEGVSGQTPLSGSG